MQFAVTKTPDRQRCSFTHVFDYPNLEVIFREIDIGTLFYKSCSQFLAKHVHGSREKKLLENSLPSKHVLPPVKTVGNSAS